MPSTKSKERGHKTPLEREYERITNWFAREDDPADRPLHELVAERTYRAEELLVWKHEIRGQTDFSRKRAEARSGGRKSLLKRELAYRNASYPYPQNLPNPLVTSDLVITACLCPSWLVALDRRSGKEQWKLETSYFPQPPLVYENGTVYGGTSQELLAIEAASGEVRWRFCPYGLEHEWIYSSPAISGDRLFIGDRAGYFRCLDMRTGEWRWWQRPSRASNININSKPVVIDDHVIVATNSAWVLCYDQASGEEIWRTRTDGPSGYPLLRYQDSIVTATPKSVYVLDPITGSVKHRYRWRNFEIHGVEAAGDVLLIVRRRFLPGGRSWPCDEMLAFRGTFEQYRLTYPLHCGPALIYSHEAQLVYEATGRGLGILEAATGRRVASITDFWTEVEHGHDMAYHEVNRPAVSEGTIYALSRNADVLALKHPELRAQY